jgi:hypothetical protein
VLRIGIRDSCNIPKIQEIVIDRNFEAAKDRSMFLTYLGIDNAIESAVKLDVDRHHGLAAHDVEIMDVRGMLEILVLSNCVIKTRIIPASYPSRTRDNAPPDVAVPLPVSVFPLPLLVSPVPGVVKGGNGLPGVVDGYPEVVLDG